MGQATDELYDIGSSIQGWEDAQEMEFHAHVDEKQRALNKLESRMAKAKTAEVGATIECAQCGRLIVKKSYQKVFCSNAKTHGKKNCKDIYHNRIAGLKEYLHEMDLRNS